MTARTAPKLHSTIVGDPEAERRIVFLHGLFGRGRNFTTVASALRPEAQSLLLDLPDHGASEWTDRVDYAAFADAVAAHLRERFASQGPVDVVGHSMGGKVAMVLALRYPELVRRLVILDISPTISDSTQTEFAHLLSSLASLDLTALEKRVDAHERLREAIPNTTVRAFLLQNLKRGADGFEWEPNLELLNREIDQVTGFPDMAGHEFDGPVLWVRGDRSNYVRDEDAPRMRALFPKVRRLTVRGAGHWVHSEKPEEVIAALRSFLL